MTLKTEAVQGQVSGPSNLAGAVITSKDDAGRSVDVSSGIIELRYYESILQDGVHATFSFVDAGNSIDNKTVMEGLPLTGSEFFTVKMIDNINNELKQTFVVKNPKPITDNNNKTIVFLPLVSEAFAKNDNLTIFDRFDGKISDHVKTMISDEKYLGSNKTLDIEETSNTLSEFGYRRKAYYLINELSKKGVPAGGEGKTAGYFFFETAESMIFKSIDSLFDEEKNPRKLSIIYNESFSRNSGIPAGYDTKALTFDRDVTDSIERNKMGANSSAAITFNPFTFVFERKIMSIVEGLGVIIEPLTTAGKALPKFNQSLIKEFGRTTLSIFDTGTYSRELDQAFEENFDINEIKNQSLSRYNQVFTSKINITIDGNFSLHAGDMVYFDAPSPQRDTRNDEVDRQSGGLYIIASLCHYITSKRTLTKLCLIRDSFGRKGNHTKR